MQCPMCGAEMRAGVTTPGGVEYACRCGTRIALPPERAEAAMDKRLTSLEIQLQQLRGDMADFAGLHTGLVKRIVELEGGKVG